FCKAFHRTMKELVKDYEKDGKVAWVYRHAFNETGRKYSRMAAEGSECVNELGGGESFWKYVDEVFDKAQTPSGFDGSIIPKIIKDVGVDESSFDACMKERRYQNKVSQDLSDAMIAGARGTPYIIIIGPTNKRYDFSGAQTKEFVKNLIELAFKEK
ncbi:DsbA family protein, partial [Patescibacteria group bacterium]|nr:DsbA family protein [Patescibacteria group bacterium]